MPRHIAARTNLNTKDYAGIAPAPRYALRLADHNCGKSREPPVADDDVQDMRDHAERFRRLARVVEDERNRRQLLEMAQELDKGADGLEQARSKKR